jgi:hypothetical protein
MKERNWIVSKLSSMQRTEFVWARPFPNREDVIGLRLTFALKGCGIGLRRKSSPMRAGIGLNPAFAPQ